MPDNILQYLPYILPTKTTTLEDKALEITSYHFKLMYGDTILKLLWYIGVLPQSAKYIKKTCLKGIIDQIILFIQKHSDDSYFIGIHNGTLTTMATDKMKKNGMEIYLQQKAENNMYPYDFMVDNKNQQLNDYYLVIETFKTLLILFDKLLLHVRTIKNDNNFNLNVSRLFHIVDATTQTNNFCRAFVSSQCYRKGAINGAKTKKTRKSVIKQAVNTLQISSKEALLPQTINKVRQEIKNTTGKKINLKDKTLQNHIIDFAGHKNSN